MSKLNDLKIHIRIARLKLGRDPYEALPRGREALEKLWRELRAELVQRGGILKEGAR